MKITSQSTDPAILQEIGERLSAARIELDLTQAALAEQAGLSKRTVERLESGEVATQLSSLLRVCRVLGLLDRFESLLPQATPSPMAQLKRRGRKRQRASGKKAAGKPAKKWRWGETS